MLDIVVESGCQSALDFIENAPTAHLSLSLTHIIDGIGGIIHEEAIFR